MSGQGPLPEEFPVLARDMAGAGSPEELCAVHSRLSAQLGGWLDQGLGAGRIGWLAALVRDQLMARAAQLALKALADPGPMGLAVLGSEGRREQYLATDQDNALVLAQEADPRIAGEFARALMDILARAGLPPCPHKVTADNLQWRMTLADWMQDIRDMAHGPDEIAVLRLSLLADMRPVWGREDLVSGLAGHLRRVLRDNTMALRTMAREAVRFEAPLGLLGGLVLDHGHLDLKRGGIFPLTQGARVLAMELDLGDTGTSQRLEGAALANVLSRDTARDLVEAYGFLQELRLRSQAAKLAQGLTPDNQISPADLSGLTRSHLKDCLGVVADFQELLSAKYSLHLLT